MRAVPSREHFRTEDDTAQQIEEEFGGVA